MNSRLWLWVRGKISWFILILCVCLHCAILYTIFPAEINPSVLSQGRAHSSCRALTHCWTWAPLVKWCNSTTNNCTLKLGASRNGNSLSLCLFFLSLPAMIVVKDEQKRTFMVRIIPCVLFSPFFSVFGAAKVKLFMWGPTECSCRQQGEEFGQIATPPNIFKAKQKKFTLPMTNPSWKLALPVVIHCHSYLGSRLLW